MIIKKLTADEFNAFFKELAPKYFTDNMNFHVFDVRSQIEIDSTDRLKASVNGKEHLYLAAYDENNKLMGWSMSQQGRMFELYTMNSCVLPEYRRQGVYTKLIEEVLRYARELGYQTITSNHILSNNSVIIAKLKLGFKIMGVEVVDDWGSLAKLCYFVNDTRARAFDVRTGYVRPDEDMKKLLKI